MWQEPGSKSGYHYRVDKIQEYKELCFCCYQVSWSSRMKADVLYPWLRFL